MQRGEIDACGLTRCPVKSAPRRAWGPRKRIEFGFLWEGRICMLASHWPLAIAETTQLGGGICGCVSTHQCSSSSLTSSPTASTFLVSIRAPVGQTKWVEYDEEGARGRRRSETRGIQEMVSLWSSSLRPGCQYAAAHFIGPSGLSPLCRLCGFVPRDR